MKIFWLRHTVQDSFHPNLLHEHVLYRNAFFTLASLGLVCGLQPDRGAGGTLAAARGAQPHHALQCRPCRVRAATTRGFWCDTACPHRFAWVQTHWIFINFLMEKYKSITNLKSHPIHDANGIRDTSGEQIYICITKSYTFWNPNIYSILLLYCEEHFPSLWPFWDTVFPLKRTGETNWQTVCEKLWA